MSQIRTFVVSGYNWETLINTDVEGKTEEQIDIELAEKALEWLNNNPDKTLKVSALFSIHEKISEEELPKSNNSKRLLNKSSFIRSKKDLFFGSTKSVKLLMEKLQKSKQSD